MFFSFSSLELQSLNKTYLFQKRKMILLPSFNISSDFEFAEIVRNSAAEFGR